jgi:multidrug transporter EmrE-like cation transporter
MLTKEEIKKKVSTSRYFNLGLIIMAFGFIFFFFAAPIKQLTQSDIDYSVFGAVLIILGTIIWLGRSKTRRRRY